jgi:hypothetical protein
VIALLRYYLADLLRSQRFFPPILAFLLAIGVLVGGTPGPALSAYGSLALVLYPVGVWLAVAVNNAEDPAQRGITVSATGGWTRVAGATTLVSLLTVLVLGLVGTAWPAIISPAPYTWPELGLGLAAQLACGWTGVAVGVLCARPILRRIGASAAAALVLVIATFAAGRRVPPVGSVLGLLAQDRPDLAAARVTVLVALAVAAVLVVHTTGLTAVVSRRRTSPRRRDHPVSGRRRRVRSGP